MRLSIVEKNTSLLVGDDLRLILLNREYSIEEIRKMIVKMDHDQKIMMLSVLIENLRDL